LDGPVTVKFLAVRKITDGDGNSSEQPVPALGFDPIITGLMDNDATDASLLTGENGAGAFRYAGVVTPKTKWCSDSCGVMSVEI
jgi:hypothetical protein